MRPAADFGFYFRRNFQFSAQNKMRPAQRVIGNAPPHALQAAPNQCRLNGSNYSAADKFKQAPKRKCNPPRLERERRKGNSQLDV